MSNDRRITRRDWLRATAGAVATTAGVSVLAGPAAAGHDTHTPAHVDDPAFEESLLENYKPKLLTGDLEVEPSAIHGFVVRSDRKDTTALVFWTEYPVQLDRTGIASHIGDHEPFYVFLQNEGTADEFIDKVVYSGYHWLAAESNDPPTDGSSPARPRAYVFPQYHHYGLQKARDSAATGEDLTLKDLTTSLPDWLDDDGFHDGLAENWQGRGSPAYNPYIMLAKASWWRKDGLTNFEELIRSLWLFLGIRGADGSDLDS